MGLSCSCDGDNRHISSFMNGAKSTDKNVVKLLLLGPGSTGKSTIFKSLRMVHSGGNISDSQKEFERRLVRINILDGIKILIDNSNILYQRDNQLYKECQFTIDDDDADSSSNISLQVNNIIQQTKSEFFDERKLTKEELIHLGECIESIWNLPSIQATYQHRHNNFAISDNLKYFFDKIQTVMSIDYLPTEEDCLKNRSKTSGMNEYEYDSGNVDANKFKILDVGGQRTERRKWINYFDNVRGLLYVASLIDYNGVLYEDSNMNAMKESVKLFSDMTRLKCFEDCSIILILNKDDLLRNLLSTKKDNGLYKCFSKNGIWSNENEYWDEKMDETYWPLISNNNDNECSSSSVDKFEEYHSIVIGFLRSLFLKRSNSKQEIYCHTTIATENKIIGKVFHNIQDIIIASNLDVIGLGDVGSGEEASIPVGLSQKENDLRVASATTSIVNNEDHSVISTSIGNQDETTC